MYHSAFSYNRLDLGVANTMLYEPIITAYPCEVSYDALIQGTVLASNLCPLAI
jgi:hypothetical protein